MRGVGAARLLAFLALWAGTPVAAADAVVVKLATLVPDGSVWHRTLQDMQEEWGRASQGRVTLRIYPGGVAGDEPDMVRKMRIGQLQGASLSVAGLAEVDPSFNVFSIPMFFDSYEEMFAVLEEMAPTLRERLEAKGFVLLNWGHGGWVHFFSTRPVRTVQDLKELKMFAWAGNNSWIEWWKDNGFRPVPLAATDILTGLQTGMIEILPTTPLAALSLQWFRRTPYMLDLGLAPLVGATVMTRKGWDRLPERDRAALLEAARRVESRLAAEVPRQDATAIEEMRKRGLTVTRVAGGAGAGEWRSAAEGFAARMRGLMVPADVFDMAVRVRDARRRQRSDGASP